MKQNGKTINSYFIFYRGSIRVKYQRKGTIKRERVAGCKPFHGAAFGNTAPLLRFALGAIQPL